MVFWLFIFVVGSLIVSFIISPKSFEEFKENYGNIIQNNLESSSFNTTNLIPYEMEEYQPYGFYYKSCASIEARGESSGIINIKQKICRESCGKRNLDYNSNDCEKDILVCYCKE